jgi:hypothetical protein
LKNKRATSFISSNASNILIVITAYVEDLREHSLLDRRPTALSHHHSIPFLDFHESILVFLPQRDTPLRKLALWDWSFDFRYGSFIRLDREVR